MSSNDREHIDIEVTAENAPSKHGRDNGKVFRITEMDADKGYKWGMAASAALLPRLAREVSPEIANELSDSVSMSTLSRIGVLLGSVSFPEVEPLLDQLMDRCVQIVEKPQRAGQVPVVRAIGLGGAVDIKENATYHLLRKEALALHTDFTFPAAIFNLMAETTRMSPF